MAKVLIIDDDTMLARLLQEHLSGEGYDVSAVTMAEEGFTKATQSPPDLIMLDVNLPDATGFQMVARFRKHPATEKVPIIMMSGAARNSNQLEIGKQMGATDYLVKPFNVVEVGEIVNKLTRTPLVAKKPPFIPFSNTAAAPAPLPAPGPEIHEKPHVEPLSHPAMPPHKEPAIDQHIEPMPAFHQEEYKQEPVHPFDTSIQAPAYEEQPFIDDPIPVETEAPAMASVLSPAKRLQWAQNFTWVILAVHAALSIASIVRDPSKEAGFFQALSYVAGGWALILGLLVGIATSVRIHLAPRSAFRILGWAVAPIALRSLVMLITTMIPSLEMMRATLHATQWPAEAFWIRPFDIFEGASILILGLSLRTQPGSSTMKALLATFLIAAAWALTSRGYFRPF